MSMSTEPSTEPSGATAALFDLASAYHGRRRRLKDLEAAVRQARCDPALAGNAEFSRTVAAAEQARFEFANAQLWADLRSIEAVSCWGEAA